jgi:hypothetical protein
MWILGAIIGVILLAALLYLAFLDGDFHVRRSLQIDASLDSTFAAIVDFKTWPQWSPWLMHEPDAQLVYSDDCRSEEGFYSWDGKFVGAGKMTHLIIKPGRSIRQQLDFIRPFKTINQVSWDFENKDGKTLVSWEMGGSMPFLFRFMAKRMEPMIGRDYELGLALLAGYLNARTPHPQLVFGGTETLQNFSYWAIPCNGNLRQLEAARRSSIATLREAATNRIGMSLTLHHHFDPLSGQYQSELAIPVNDNMPSSNYLKRGFAGGAYYKISLQGDLEFLPLAWHALASHCRMRKIKTDPTRPALEIYQHDPGNVADNGEVLTTLYLPIKTKLNQG